MHIEVCIDVQKKGKIEIILRGHVSFSYGLHSGIDLRGFEQKVSDRYMEVTIDFSTIDGQ